MSARDGVLPPDGQRNRVTSSIWAGIPIDPGGILSARQQDVPEPAIRRRDDTVETTERDRPTVLITGATSGIRLSNCNRAGAAGARVARSHTIRPWGQSGERDHAYRRTSESNFIRPNRQDTGNRHLAARVDAGLGERQTPARCADQRRPGCFRTTGGPADGTEQTLVLIGVCALTKALLPARAPGSSTSSRAPHMWKGDPVRRIRMPTRLRRRYSGARPREAPEPDLDLRAGRATGSPFSVDATKIPVHALDRRDRLAHRRGGPCLAPHLADRSLLSATSIRGEGRRTRSGLRRPDATALTGYYVDKRKRQRPHDRDRPGQPEEHDHERPPLIHQTSSPPNPRHGQS